MHEKTIRKDTMAILVSILFLALGFAAVWLLREVLKLEGDAIYVSLLFVPILVYVIVSGRLGELKGPGGLEAKFVNVAEESLELGSEIIESAVGEMEMIAKGGARELRNRIGQFDESKPIILTLTLGREGYYHRGMWLQYLEALSQYRTFRFVVFLDRDDRFTAYIPSWAVLRILRMEALGDEFVSIINQGNTGELQRYPGVVTRAVSTQSTNVEALREMTAQNLDALVIIDQDRRVKGVVEREQLLSKLLLAMAGR